jgi:molybdopterin-guanine dinucleotide biosynthesis protein A
MAAILPHVQTGTDAAPVPHDHVDFAACSGGEVDMITGTPGTPGTGGRPGTWAAVVLAGGGGHRLGGVDKPALVVGGRTLLDTALAACSDSAQIVAVGPVRPTSTAVRWTQESPAGSGPLAALSAGIGRLSADVEVVVVLAADLPSVESGTVGRLRAALGESRVDAVVLTDQQGRVQPLLGAYRLPALRHALNAVGDARDLPFGRLLDHLSLATIPDNDSAADDIDTPQDLDQWTPDREE